MWRYEHALSQWRHCRAKGRSACRMAWLVDGRLQWYRGEVLATRESGGEEGEGGQGEPADLWETLRVLWEDSEGWDHRPDDEAAQAGWERRWTGRTHL